MIYLIGGAPRCGKTTVAKNLSQKLGAPWIASDTLEVIVMGYTSEQNFADRFPKTIVRKETENSNDIMYTKYTPEQIAELYIKQGKAVWTAVEMLAEAEIKEGGEFIVEGHHIHPELVMNLKEKFGKDKIKSAFLAKTDVEGIEENAIKYADENDWFTKKTQDKKIYRKIAEMISELSRCYQEEAEKNNLSVFNMDRDFEKQIAEIEFYLLK